MKLSRATISLVLALAVATPAAAVQDPQRPSSLMLFGLRRLGCDIALSMIERYLGVGETAREAAERWGICPPLADTEAPPEPAVISPTPPPGGLQPGLSLTLFEVSGPDSSALSPAGPETRYARGEGFVALLNFNAPGYLEVWSVDGETETFVEAIALNPAGGTALALPARGGPAFYQFTTAGSATEYLRLRYYPCRGLSDQTFTITRNTHLAGALSALGSQGETLRQTLPSCPFAAAEFNPERALPVFGSSLAVTADWSAEESRYVAVLDRVVHEGRRSLTVDIPLRRE